MTIGLGLKKSYRDTVNTNIARSCWVQRNALDKQTEHLTEKTAQKTLLYFSWGKNGWMCHNKYLLDVQIMIWDLSNKTKKSKFNYSYIAFFRNWNVVTVMLLDSLT